MVTSPSEESAAPAKATLCSGWRTLTLTTSGRGEGGSERGREEGRKEDRRRKGGRTMELCFELQSCVE